MRVLILVIALLAFSLPAKAQLKITEEEKAVFAFFKLAEHVPNYKSWVMAMPSYNQAGPDMREDIYHLEETRLKWGFGTYDETDEFLKIRTEAELILNETDEQTILHFRFPGSAGEEYPYFPYPYAEAWIALVISDLGRFTSIPLSPEQTKNIKTMLDGATKTPVKMKMRVRPLEADIEKPLEMDGAYFWIMGGDIAYLEFISKDKEQTLFEYTAPWYLTSAESELLEMLQ